jgi:NAD(P)-dependent dehydrogenase (short-subunit alcohol dehydrogenase family)
VTELTGKNALVTGASRGIGAAIAERFAAEGAVVVLAARTLDTKGALPGTLRETARRIEARGGRAMCVAADMSRADDRTRLVAEAEAAVGRIDILVNNAAASFYRPFLDWTDKRFAIAFEINVRAAFDLVQRIVPSMKTRGSGWILNISSKTAVHPVGPPYDDFHRHGGDLLYGMTKAALDRFSTGLAAELDGHGITVNSLAPVAAVLTPGVEALGVVPESFRRTAEPVEAMAEAAVVLCAPGAPTGRVAYSLELLASLGRPIRRLDGVSLLSASGR